MCNHPDVHYHINRNRFENTNLEYLEISGKCKSCDAPIHFRCGLTGMSPNTPGVDLAGTSLSIPTTIGDEPYDGKAIGGYSIRTPQEEEPHVTN
jgi:hypothetical protein